MVELNLDIPVGELVAQRPLASNLFESLKIDYCCRGGQSLRQACADRGLDPGEVLDRIAAAEADAAERAKKNGSDADMGAVRWIDAPLAELCDHIESTHHAYLKRELPRLRGTISKVMAAHVANHPELYEVGRAFADLLSELEPHMFKEERILFPAIRQLESTAQAPAFPFGTVANPIRMMEHEHDNAGEALVRIREATSDFRAPTDACSTFRTMHEDLSRLESDMHQHVHKENNILFPRAIALERKLSARQPIVH